MPLKGLYERSVGLTPGSTRLLFARGFLPAVGGGLTNVVHWGSKLLLQRKIATTGASNRLPALPGTTITRR